MTKKNNNKNKAKRPNKPINKTKRLPKVSAQPANPWRTRGVKGAMSVVRRAMTARGVGNGTMIAKTLSLPSDHPPLRLPEMGRVLHTCALKLNATQQAAAVQGMYLQSGVQRWAMFQNPVLPVWCDKPLNRGIDIATFSIETLTFPGAASGEPVPQMVSASDMIGYGNWINGTRASSGIVGVACNRQWVYTPYGSRIQIGVRAVGAISFSGTLQATYEMYDGGNVQTTTAVISTSGDSGFVGWKSVVATISKDGYSWARLAKIESINASYSVAAAGNVVFGAELCVTPGVLTYDQANVSGGVEWNTMQPWTPGVGINSDASTVPYQSSRLTSASLLLSNVTSYLNQEGSILAARINPSTKSPWTFDAATLAGISDTDKANLKLATGVYTFLAPEILPMRDYYVVASDGMHPVMYLDDLPYTNVLILSDQNPTSVSNVNVTFSMHVEFMSSLQLFPVGYSHVDPMMYHQALLALARTGFFFENPTHFKDLAKRIGALMSAGWRFAKPALITGAKAAGASLLQSLL